MKSQNVDRPGLGRGEEGADASPRRTSSAGGLGPLSVLRQSAKLTSANLLALILMLPVNFLFARVLGPDLLGIVGYVTLWQFYVGLFRPATFGAAYREMPGLLARGEVAAAVRVQNIGITSETCYLALGSIVMLTAAVLDGRPLVRGALLVGTAVMLITQAQGFAAIIHWAHDRFSLLAKARAISVIASACFSAATVTWIGIYAVLVYPAVAAMVSLMVYRILSGPAGFRFEWDWPEVLRLLRIGIPLALGTAFYFGFRTVDRAVTVTWLPLSDLGYLTFVLLFVNFGISIVADFVNVVQQRLWAAMGIAGEAAAIGPFVGRLSVLMLLATCAAINVGQALFDPVVRWLVPKFNPAVPVFDILFLVVAFGTIAVMPSQILNSALVNRQKLATALYGGGLAINLALALVAVTHGWGLRGVALSSVVAQAAVGLAFLWATRSYLAPSLVRFGLTLATILSVMLLAVLITIALASAQSPLTGFPIVARVAIPLAIWSIVALVLVRPLAGFGPRRTVEAIRAGWRV